MKNIKMTDRTMKLNLANKYVNEDVIVETPDDYIKPEGTIEITENGTVDVTNYASANVFVPNIVNGVPIEISSLDSSLLIAENENKLYRFNGEIYKVVADMETAMLVDLTGATIIVPAGWTSTKAYGKFYLSGTATYNNSTKVLTTGAQSFNIGYWTASSSSDNYIYINLEQSGFSISNSNSFKLNITGGNNRTNQDLIQWFLDNNATIEGGVWTITNFTFQKLISPSGTKQITANDTYDIKEYESVEVNVPNIINGIPIEIPSLDSSYLIEENQGKIYKCDGKLYRVEIKKGTINYISLKNSKAIIPSGFTVSGGYGKFHLLGSFSLIGISISGDFYDSNPNFELGYSNVGSTKNFFRCLVADGVSSRYSPNNNSYGFILNITGGTSCNDIKLMQFLQDNNATIEGGVFTADFIFQEILSPTGTLEVTENGEVDVKNYEKVNVSVESSGGSADLNIHYGLTAPEDTSKLWIKTENTPSKVEIKNSISGGNESIKFWDNSLPARASNISSAVVNKKVYLFGGYCFGAGDDTYLNTINVFDTESNTITTLGATLPTRAQGISSAVIGTKVYLFGGHYYSDSDIYLNTINVFDTETNTFQALSTTLPKGVRNISSAVVGTKVYLFGGYRGSVSNSYLNTINVFDTESNTITTLGATLPTASGDIANAVVGTKVYLFGGFKYPGTSYGHQSLNTINVFDTETNTIQTLSTTLPTISSRISSAVIGTKVYLFGGYNSYNAEYIYLNTINVFDTETNTIQTLSTTLPTGTYYISSAVIGTKVYLFGGCKGIYNLNSSYLNTINVFSLTFDVANNTLFLLNQITNNKVSIIKNNGLDIEIGVKMALLGNSENIGEEVDALKNKIVKKYNNYYTSSATQLESGTELTASVKCNVGDLVVCAIATRDTLTLSEGWTLVSTSEVNSVDTAGNGQRLSWAYKYAESTTESITVTQASEQRLYINMIALQGATGVTDNGYTYRDDTTSNSLTVEKPSGLVLWGLCCPLWSTVTPFEEWKSSNNIPIIQLNSSFQQRLGIGVDQTDETSVTFIAPDDVNSSMIVGCLIVQGMNKFYDEYEVQEWIKL